MSDESTLRYAGCLFDMGLEETVLNTKKDIEEMEQCSCNLEEMVLYSVYDFEEMEPCCFEGMVCSREKL